MLETTARLRQQLDETVQAVASRSRLRPRLGLVMGSGLGGLTAAVSVDAEVDYAELPHMPRSTAPGHKGALVLGHLGAQPDGVADMRGRCPRARWCSSR